jgi:hypothetical protein
VGTVTAGGVAKADVAKKKASRHANAQPSQIPGSIFTCVVDTQRLFGMSNIKQIDFVLF